MQGQGWVSHIRSITSPSRGSLSWAPFTQHLLSTMAVSEAAAAPSSWLFTHFCATSQLSCPHTQPVWPELCKSSTTQNIL